MKLKGSYNAKIKIPKPKLPEMPVSPRNKINLLEKLLESSVNSGVLQTRRSLSYWVSNPKFVFVTAPDVDSKSQEVN